MKFIKFSTRLWEDSYISTLSYKEKLFFIYLISNSRVNKVGIYELPDKYIKADLDLSDGEIVEMKKKFEADNKFHFYKGWVYIVNFAKHNKFSTAENIIKDFKREFDNIPKEVKDYFILKKGLGYIIPIENTDKVRLSLDVSVMVIVIVIVNRVGGILPPTLQKEEKVDVDEVIEGIEREHQIEKNDEF